MIVDQNQPTACFHKHLLLEHSHVHLCIVYSCVHATMERLSIYKRGFMFSEVQSIYYLPLYKNKTKKVFSDLCLTDHKFLEDRRKMDYNAIILLIIYITNTSLV